MPSARPRRSRKLKTHAESPRLGPDVPARPRSDLRQWRGQSRSVAQTRHVGFLLGQSMQGGEILALYGDLGSGKTTLVRGLAQGLGAPPDLVTSPTFVFVHEYPGRLPLIHIDLYRLEALGEVDQIGLSDYFDGRRVVAIEWPDKLGAALPTDHLELHLSHHSLSRRDIVLRSTGTKSQRLLTRALKRLTAQRARGTAKTRQGLG